MPLHEHYLVQDLPQVEEQRDLILKVCMNAMQDTKEGSFINKSQYIQELHGAFDMLSALNAKKKHRDQNNELYVRRGWRFESD